MIYDRIRQQWTLLAPERVIKANGSAAEILKLCDGARDCRQIAAILSEKYGRDAAVIEKDACALLGELAQKRMVEAAS